MTRTHGRRVCPGCGVVLTRGSQTKEHVWSDWLRRYGVAYPRLSPDFFGQRSPLPQRRMVTGANGRRQYEEVAGPVVSDFLATVTMSVCGNCNNTWMSQIENAAKDELAPVFWRSTRVDRHRTDQDCHLGSADPRRLLPGSQRSGGRSDTPIAAR